MGYNLVINGVYWAYNPLILTFDPNFLGHLGRNLLAITRISALFKALRIMGSQNRWFRDPRPLLYTSKPLFSAGSSDS